jgi:hypothetical protein
MAGLALLCGLYGSLYRKIRKLSEGSLRVIFIGLLVFIVIRGLAEAEPFDLLLPLWAIVLVTSLVTRRETVTGVVPSEALPSGVAYGAELKSNPGKPFRGGKTTAYSDL